MSYRFPGGLGAAVALSLFLFVGSVQAAPRASDASDEPGFAVTSFALHADLPKAEACVSLSAPIDPAERAPILAALNLRKDGRKEKIAAKDLSLTPSDICVQNLDRRASYRLTLRSLESAAGEPLEESFTQSFKVPDLKPFIGFVSNSNLPVLPRHLGKSGASSEAAAPTDASAAHVLRSVNVPETHLTLFRMADRDTFAGAWQQFLLSNLSPSESLYFAKTKGQKVFESDLVFGVNPNVEQTLVAPLPPDAQLEPGLYYLAAAPKKQEGDEQTLYAGQWFLVSSLRLSSLRLPDGVEVFAGDMETGRPMGEADIRLLARDGRVLAEAKTGHDGVAMLRLDAKKMAEATLLTGQATNGNLDLIGFGANDRPPMLEPLSLEAFVHPDQDAYLPGSTASVALRAEDPDGASVTLEGSALKLLQPDRRLYSQQIVPADKDGVHLMNVSLPYAGQAGDWTLQWTRADGSVVAESSVRIADEIAPRKIDLSVSHDAADPAVAIKVTDGQGRPVAFDNGQVTVRGARPAFPSWKGYRFGVAPIDPERPLQTVAFMTDQDGTAKISLSASKAGGADERAALKALNVGVLLTQSGAKAEIAVTQNRSAPLVGIRALSDGRMFAENSIASFGVIAVDGSGKRVAENNLSYLVFEEGRSFEWFPSEGHWDYKPLPQHRRVGGGLLSVSATGEAVVRWPVTAGHYVLEIVDEDGAVLAQQAFDAGRVAFALANGEDGRLSFVSPPTTLKEKTDNPIKIHLEAPALVSVVAVDSRVRETLYRFMPAGTGEIVLSPKSDWGDKAVIRVQALFRGSPVPATVRQLVSIRHKQRELPLDLSKPGKTISGGGFSFTAKTAKSAKGDPLFLSVLATPLTSENGDEELPTARLDRVPVDAEGKAQVKLNLPLFTGRLRVAVMAWNKAQYGEQSFEIPAAPALSVRTSIPDVLTVGDRLDASLRVVNEAAPGGAYVYDLFLPAGVGANVPLKGKLTIGKQKASFLAPSLTAREETDGSMRLELSGPEGAKSAQAWPLTVRADKEMPWATALRSIAPGKSERFALSERGKGADGFALLLAASPLPDPVPALKSMARAEPLSTVDIALWLEAAQLWADPLRELDLIGESRMRALRASYLEALQRRQNGDGGFAAQNATGPSDMASTAAAIVALRDQAERPVALATEWLTHKLQNTWFDESERAVRAVCFEALARAHRADLSGLRYFSETSRDKKLPPETAALIGVALEEGGDADASHYWIGKAKESLSGLAKDDTRGYWASLRLLSRSPSVTVADLAPSLKTIKPLSPGASLDERAGLLTAVFQTAQKAGGWSAQVNGKETKSSALVVLHASEREEKVQTFDVLSASGLNALGIGLPKKDMGAAGNGKAKAAQDIQRQLFRLDGRPVEATDVLLQGETYVLIVRGTGGSGGAESQLAMPQGGAFTLDLPVEQAALVQAMPWLAGFPLSDGGEPMQTTEALGLTFDSSASWRLAFLLKPVAQGTFILPAPRLTSASGQEVPLNVPVLRSAVR